MNTLIIKCLAELLYEHECVIIPEFGAFISKNNSARLDYPVHRLTPPSKELAFNAQLTVDDGLFIGYLAEKQHITHKEATEMLHNFAMQSLARLEVEKELQLDGVGKLYYIDSQNITFVVDPEMNFCSDAFGLNVFTVQPIYRSEIYTEVKATVEQERTEKATEVTVAKENIETQPNRLTRKNYRWYRAAAYSMIVATAMVLLGWGADKSGANVASWNPLFYSSPNEFIAKYLNDNINARETFIVDRIESVPVQMIEVEERPMVFITQVEINPVPIIEQVASSTDEKIYSIIGASFDIEADALKCARRFRELGFADASVLPLSDNGRYRVEYESVAGKEAAKARLEIIKSEHNASAWLLLKK